MSKGERLIYGHTLPERGPLHALTLPLKLPDQVGAEGHCHLEVEAGHDLGVDRHGEPKVVEEKIRQIHQEPEDASTCRCNIGTVEEGGDEEAKHDAGRGVEEQEEEDEPTVGVVQHLAVVRGKGDAQHDGADGDRDEEEDEAFDEPGRPVEPVR